MVDLKEKNKKYIVYGTGAYCRQKISSVLRDFNVVGYVDRCEGHFRGEKVFPIEMLQELDYDYIIVLSRYLNLIEITANLIRIGVSGDRIILGINLLPLTVRELELVGKGGKYEVDAEGNLIYSSPYTSDICVRNNDDWSMIESGIISVHNADVLQNLISLPVTKTYGANRGGSIVRYYINSFLSDNSKFIRGKILEIGDAYYTKQFAADGSESYIMQFGGDNTADDHIFSGNLINGDGINGKTFDCIILTQVLNFVEDIRNTPNILLDALNPGGTLLLTVSGITQICRADMQDYGQFWSFTDRSINNMFKGISSRCEISTYGNLKSTSMFLAGMGCDDISKKELDYMDEDYQLVITARITK